MYLLGIDEVRDLMNRFDPEELVFVGVENILASREAGIKDLEEQPNKWLEIYYRLGRD